MNRYLLVLINLFLTIHCFGQSIDRQVYSAAGKETKNQTLLYTQGKYMTYTIGEPIIRGNTVGTRILSNGFIQPNGITLINPPLATAITLSSEPYLIYPNPFDGSITIEAPSENQDTVNLQLIDMNGRLVREVRMESARFFMEIPESAAPGNYFLNVYHLNGTFIQQQKMVKMANTYSNTKQ
jgi:hypothetical protein